MTRKFKFETSDYILYILQKLRPNQSTKLVLNKIAFFVEFGYYHKTNNELSNSKYAGINYGPVIDEYQKILNGMQKKGLILMEGNYIRLIKQPIICVPEEISAVIDPILEKYTKLTPSELVHLSHYTDSYQITTDCEKNMGNIIDKNLANLESFFDYDECEEEIDENKLPNVKKNNLVDYGI